MLRQAIDSYHALLTDELAGESQLQLDSQLKSRGLFFGDRPLCTVLRPRFLVPKQYRFCQERATVVLGAFAKAHQAALQHREFRAQFGLMDWEDRLVDADPMAKSPSPTSRLDAFFVSAEHGLRFTEYNAETPAGPAYNDALTQLFDALPVMRQFSRSFQLRPLPVRAHVLNALLTAHEKFSGRGKRPRIAILDWPEVPTYSEFLLFQRYFHEQGLECVIADPREAEYREGRLYVQGAPVTLIYKRVLISELVERCGENHDVIRAVKDGAVCMVNSFASKILHKKASLAVLSDERNAHLFSSAEQRAIEQHIPWSRVVTERHTVLDGDTIDLLPHIREKRDGFVLKPNDDYGGKGILLGWEVTSEQWDEGLRLASEQPYIVQRRITLPTAPYPSMADGRVVFAERMLDTAPFVFNGEYVDGCLTRLSTAALLNVTHGGGSSVPTYLVERR